MVSLDPNLNAFYASCVIRKTHWACIHSDSEAESCRKTTSFITAREKAHKPGKNYRGKFHILKSPSRLFEAKFVPESSLSIERKDTFQKKIYESRKTLHFCRNLKNSVTIHLISKLRDYVPISIDEVSRAISWDWNLGAAGIDCIIAFWWKSISSVHGRLVQIFTPFIRGKVPIPS